MSLTGYRNSLPLDLEKYLPLIYIIAMPPFNILVLGLSINHPLILLKYWIYASGIQLGIWYIVKRILYEMTYRPPIKWILAFLSSCLYLFFTFL